MSTKSAKKIIRSVSGHISFGEVLFAIREEKEKTQVEWAEKLGISKQALCNIEKGRKKVSIERAILFAKKLRQPPEVFAKYVLEDQLWEAGLKKTVEIKEAG